VTDRTRIPGDRTNMEGGRDRFLKGGIKTGFFKPEKDSVQGTKKTTLESPRGSQKGP